MSYSKELQEDSRGTPDGLPGDPRGTLERHLTDSRGTSEGFLGNTERLIWILMGFRWTPKGLSTIVNPREIPDTWRTAERLSRDTWRTPGWLLMDSWGNKMDSCGTFPAEDSEISQWLRENGQLAAKPVPPSTYSKTKLQFSAVNTIWQDCIFFMLSVLCVSQHKVTTKKAPRTRPLSILS